MPLVDTAALAAHLSCSPGYVRLLVHAQVIAPLGRRRLAPTGRPTMWFDVDMVDAALIQAYEARRVVLDQGAWRLRKSSSSCVIGS